MTEPLGRSACRSIQTHRCVVHVKMRDDGCGPTQECRVKVLLQWKVTLLCPHCWFYPFILPSIHYLKPLLWLESVIKFEITASGRLSTHCVWGGIEHMGDGIKTQWSIDIPSPMTDESICDEVEKCKKLKTLSRIQQPGAVWHCYMYICVWRKKVSIIPINHSLPVSVSSWYVGESCENH